MPVSARVVCWRVRALHRSETRTRPGVPRPRRPQTLNEPYGLLRDLLCWRFEIQDSDNPEAAQAKLAQGLGPVFGPRADEQTALLGQLIGLDYGASPHIAGILGDGRQLRARAFHAGVEYFRGLVRGDNGGAVLMLLDDVQWADDGSLDFIEQLARDGVELPLLVVGAARPALFERRPAWGGETARRMGSSRSASSTATRSPMSCWRASTTHLGVVRELLIGAAEGNPFYMEELMLMLIDDGVIVTARSAGRCCPKAARGATCRHPDGRTAGTHRCATRRREHALQQASVIGRLFWDEALAQLNPQLRRRSRHSTGATWYWPTPPARSSTRGSSRSTTTCFTR